ncbi:nucleoside triphosphate pyrophosphohydrolase [Erythrobacter sp. NFXS35]|uniref:nucleoside triphosphate pyrophosphohydrolase n=1 Tax=Erythrobacter sp. NFXS35 TaxID=2818436 RepID=UPI0032DF9966
MSEVPPIERLLTIMARLRDRATGCEWDLAQTFETIAPYTIEEAYEVADAIARNDVADLKDELGDLLFQVVFHARLAEERGYFVFADVANAISNKMEARHPHIFAGAGGTMDDARWEDIKEGERTAKGVTSALDGVASALPALMRAQKLQKRAARTGFDWPDPSGSEAKVIEELEELNSATSEANRIEEAGDLLFAVVNFVRAHGINAEDALRAANAKFERRFRAMEDKASGNFQNLALDAQEVLWQQVKDAE